MAGTTVTTLAKKKMVKARAGISSLPKIVGMAFGDGGVDSGGTVKPHSADQNTLHHELLRKNVAMKAFLKKGKDADMECVFECDDTF